MTTGKHFPVGARLSGAVVLAFERAEKLNDSVYLIKTDCCGKTERLSHDTLRARVRVAKQRDKDMTCKRCAYFLRSDPRPKRPLQVCEEYLIWQWAHRIWSQSIKFDAR